MVAGRSRLTVERDVFSPTVAPQQTPRSSRRHAAAEPVAAPTAANSTHSTMDIDWDDEVLAD